MSSPPTMSAKPSTRSRSVARSKGAVVQAAGYSILENFVQKDGYVQTPHFSTYLIPTVLDVPEQVQSLILEFPDPNGPWGHAAWLRCPSCLSLRR